VSALAPTQNPGTVEHLDERDRALVASRMAARQRHSGPQEGDFVRFPDGVLRRISYLWPDGAQTSDGGRFHLCESGACSFSGSLYLPVPLCSLRPTSERRLGWAWIFHHDQWRADNGVEFRVAFPVFECSESAPTV
jgi:hypothetical protein